MWDVNIINNINHNYESYSAALTMWDVNNSNVHQYGKSYKCCLNYVGCKYTPNFPFFVKGHGAALTMWDVDLFGS